ncbi:MAG: DMT family transporter, partial [Chlorobiales bacterium]|nr:DMT family transporter [Chlorobiales bacterium]
ADALTLAFAAPLIVTALSRPFLGESVGYWRWAAVIIGFLGVLVVLRPGFGVIHPSALWALFGAALYAVLSLTARKLSGGESTYSLTLYLFIVPTLAGLVVSRDVWVGPTALDWLLFALGGAFGGVAFAFINAAFQRAPAAVIVPFEYTGLIWGALAGFVFWGEIPAANTWLGAAIIIASGLVILYRETVTSRRRAGMDFPIQEAVVLDSEER